MVVVVALVLAFAALSLQPRQKANEDNETKTAILTSIGQAKGIAGAKDKTAYINEEYGKYIAESFAVDHAGNVVEGADAFELLGSLKAEYAKDEAERALPVFVGTSEEGRTVYVLPLWGSGLWGALWGYLALEGDMETIYGVVFDHASETPGLGAEIATPAFGNQFKGKSIFKDGKLAGVRVLKGAGSSAGNNNAVDAISGGTITSRGVQDMIMAGLEGYAGFIAKRKDENTAASARSNVDAEELPVVGNQPLTVEGNE